MPLIGCSDLASRSISCLRSVNWFRLSVGLVLLAGVVGAYIEFDAAKLQQGLLWVQENKTKGWYLFLVRVVLIRRLELHRHYRPDRMPFKEDHHLPHEH